MQLMTLWFCRNHPDAPWTAKTLAMLVVAYAFSPIDLIPDFIPVLGYLDDLILVPLGIYLALKLMPDHVLREARALALASQSAQKPNSYWAAGVIVLVWIAVAYWAWTVVREIW
jgi:uncharacterized membrane protein YkvA (DUF1232 family)